MADDPFRRDHAPRVGVAEALAPGLRVVTAPNPGPMTFTGTRSYIVGEGTVAVIDPGPDDAAHRAALVAAVAGARVAAVLVTHGHLDHSAGAAGFAAAVGAPVLARGPVATVPLPGFAGAGGEGRDAGFRPDAVLADGDTVSGPDWTLTTVATPGHTADHLAFAWAEGDALFSGDHVMGWATTLISPPDGRLAAFRDSLRRLEGRGEGVYYPGHGAPVTEPSRVVAHILAHRAGREAGIVAALGEGPATVAELVRQLYADVDPVLHPAAARNVLAHLVDLAERDLVVAGDGRFALAGR